MTTLPSAEELLFQLGAHRNIRTRRLLRDDRNAVLEAAAEVADAERHYTRSGPMPSDEAMRIAEAIRALKEDL